MGNCASAPPEHDPRLVQSSSYKHNTINSASSIRRDSTTMQSPFSIPGQLEVPPRLKKWFPAQNANKNVRKLFKWHEEIGLGETGSVHFVTYQEQRCALKKVDRSNKWAEMLFITEARVLSKLRHRGVIGFVDVFLDEKYFYLAMERADFDLFHMMKDSGPWDEMKTRRITFALLEVVSYLHSKNLVHRDLKPENIVFCRGNLMEPKLIDFGDSAMVKKDKLYTEFVGTAPYMAAERWGEHKGWTLKKSDIWAVAVIAYEMFVGKGCFQGTSREEMFGNISRGLWSWPQDRTPSNPMQELIRKCLSLDASNRPSAEEAMCHSWFYALIDRTLIHNLVSMVETNPLQDLLVKVYAERLRKDDLATFRQHFRRLDVDHDGLLTQTDLVRSLSMAPLLATKMIVHLQKGRKDAKNISFDRFLESRLKYDLSQKTQAIFEEIVAAQPTTSALVGFDSASTVGSPTNSTPTVQSAEDRISLSAVTEFAGNQFSFEIDFSSTGSLEKVFQRFGDDEGRLNQAAFAKAMNVRGIVDALGVGTQ